ncbi:MAG: D-2-hydroxyacid dehydrogenase [Dehalococcoidales bacterium]|nr:D-2-hydroxyacid dehydrogenase [Dehalococcoidales bacterium]
MSDINVLVLAPLGDECLSRISAVSPQVKVTDASGLAVQPVFQSTRKEHEVSAELDSLLSRAEVLVGLRYIPDLIARAPRLKWVQTLSAGVENILSEEMVSSTVILTNVSGIHTVQINELVFGLILGFAKHLPQCLENQRTKKWERFAPDILRGRTLGIVGLGKIGSAIARTGKFLGMRVLATRRSAKGVTHTRYADAVYPPGQIEYLLRGSDYLVLALPFTPSTEKFIGEKELSLMKSTAFLVNIGRGRIVDEEALVQALEHKRIAGAGLDTFTVEPLPPSSPLWTLPNVIITPHIAGAAEDYMLKATDVFCENIRRYLNGRRLINVVDKKLGY